MRFHHAEYIWIDGSEPTQTLRSKTRILPTDHGRALTLADLPRWSFDGSSTHQAEEGNSDLFLGPVSVVLDPIRGGGSVLVLCEVLDADGTPHASDTRAALAALMAGGAGALEPWIGFEQGYTLFDGEQPLGWPDGYQPVAQGPFYCGVGAHRAFGRSLVEEHAAACIEAGLMLHGTHAEAMPGQWKFQVGYRGVDSESADPLNVSDHLWMSRWLLLRLAEDHGLAVSFDHKPANGDRGGAGTHTNFSTRAMREPGGISVIETAIERLATRHDHHIAAYGAGLHETCSIHAFKGGVADRGASIRIPRTVAREGAGYFEDRRPGANCDPYTVSRLLLAAAIERLPTAA
ncbi:MAG: glutamine synthetase beta-grasp domain-containing protein [Planctomycetota bacterium]